LILDLLRPWNAYVKITPPRGYALALSIQQNGSICDSGPNVFLMKSHYTASGASASPKGGRMRRLLFVSASILFYCACSTASADIYAWMDENGVRHFTNYAPPPQAKVIMKTKELPYDRQADEERMQTERLDQLAAALQEVAEKEAQLAKMQLEAERRIEAANRKAQEALEQAESLLNQAQYESDGYGSSRYGYPYKGRYNHSVYNRWYYRNSSILYEKHHHDYRHKHYYKKKYRYKKRHDYKYRGGGHRSYQVRKNHLSRRSPAMRGGFGHRSRAFGQRSFSFYK
jgi:hypothetical protein